VRPYLDTLPFYGTITAIRRRSGYLDAMDLTLDWAFADAHAREIPSVRSREMRRWRIAGQWLTFSDFNLRRSNIDLRTRGSLRRR